MQRWNLGRVCICFLVLNFVVPISQAGNYGIQIKDELTSCFTFFTENNNITYSVQTDEEQYEWILNRLQY